jgi:hypothetical protein
MFRIEFFVDDKKLPAALLALVGIAHSQPSVTPVVNVKKKSNGQLAAKSGGNTMERFTEALQAHKGETLKGVDFRAMMKPLGVSDKSYSYFLAKAVKAKLVKRTGTGRGTNTQYAVL